MLTGHSQLGDVAASFTVTVPIAIFVLGIWWIAIRENADRVVNVALPLGAVLVLFDPIIPIPITLTAVIMVLMVVVLVLHPPVTAHTAAGRARALITARCRVRPTAAGRPGCRSRRSARPRR